MYKSLDFISSILKSTKNINLKNCKTEFLMRSMKVVLFKLINKLSEVELLKKRQISKVTL